MNYITDLVTRTGIVFGEIWLPVSVFKSPFRSYPTWGILKSCWEYQINIFELFSMNLQIWKLMLSTHFDFKISLTTIKPFWSILESSRFSKQEIHGFNPIIGRACKQISVKSFRIEIKGCCHKTDFYDLKL